MAEIARSTAASKAPEGERPAWLLWLYRALLRADVLDLLAILAVLLVVVRSVEAARWVPMPPLTLTVLLAVLACYAVARSPWRTSYKHVAATLVGALVVYVQVASIVEGQSWLERFATMHQRLSAWARAIVEEDASTDLLPFALILTTFAWGISYLATWTILKRLPIWLVVIPSGLGLVANLSWLPSGFYVYLVAYIAAVMLLAAHTHNLRKQGRWARSGDSQPVGNEYLVALAHAFWIGALVLAIAVALPARGWTNTVVKEISTFIHRPIETLRIELSRAFSIPAKTPSSLRFFGSVLPLQRQVPLGEDPIFMTREKVSTYWPIKAYSDYTSTAWKVEETQFNTLEGVTSVGALDIEELVAAGNLTLVGVDVLVDTPYMFLPHGVLTLNREARAEVHEIKAFHLDVAQPERSEDLPPELAQWLQRLSADPQSSSVLRDFANDPSTFVIVTGAEVRRASGQEVSVPIGPAGGQYLQPVIDELDNGAQLLSLDVRRIGPTRPDYLSIRPKNWMRSGEFYSFEADLVAPSEAILRLEGPSYPAWVRDHYLDLPPDLPQRVRDLALEITRDAPTTYDKAVAIENYLRENYQYDLYPPPLEFGEDGVDKFLFESKRGYSDYFASAMAVMLRTLGIPSRVAVGYTSGQLDEETNAYVIRDKDSHTWPEVFFTNVGWVEFEPSPIHPKRPRSDAPATGLDILVPGPTESVPPAEEQPPAPEEKREVPVPGRLPGGRGLFPAPLLEFGTPLGRDGLVFAIVLAVLSAGVWLLWRQQFLVLRNADDAYLQLQRISAFLGLKVPSSQTPYEFAAMLSKLVPQVEKDVALICNGFVRRTYGRKRLSLQERFRVSRAWRRVRNSLLRELAQHRDVQPQPQYPPTPSTHRWPALPAR